MKPKIILGLKILIIMCVAALTALLYLHKTDFTSVDLGRHLKNGQQLWQNIDLLFKNFYSYTEPQAAFVNHHWLSGVIFYVLYLIGGLKLLTLVNAAIALAAVLIIFKLAVNKANFWLASILILPVILILNERTEIRPEMISYLFLAITFYLIDQYRQTQEVKKLYWLIPLMAIWVNSHIYFFLGLFLISLVLLEEIINKHKHFFKVAYCRRLLYITLASFAASLLNPNFIRGLLYPFNIFRQYGYDIVENKSPVYLEKLMINYDITIFKILAALLLISLVVVLWRRRKIAIFDAGVVLFFTALAFFAIRNLPLFALMILPIMAENFYSLKRLVGERLRQGLALSLIIVMAYAGVFTALIKDYGGARWYLKDELGLGAASASQASINFFKDNNLSGPIFNNYDLGSALIFWLYPKERVFVDNRPEAYSLDFFNHIYKPMQDNETAWKKYSEQYNFNIIYFSHTDGTPWAQKFLANRPRDDNWPLIYFDDYTVIMVKHTAANKDLIAKYKYDAEKFSRRFNLLLEQANSKEKMHLAQLAELSGRNELAQKVYQETLNVQPDNGMMLAAMGYSLLNSSRAGDWVKSLDYLNRAVANGYKLPAVYNQLGLIYWDLGDQAGAKEMWRRALKLDRGNEHAKDYLRQAGEKDELRITNYE